MKIDLAPNFPTDFDGEFQSFIKVNIVVKDGEATAEIAPGYTVHLDEKGPDARPYVRAATGALK